MDFLARLDSSTDPSDPTPESQPPPKKRMGLVAVLSKIVQDPMADTSLQPKVEINVKDLRPVPS